MRRDETTRPNAARSVARARLLVPTLAIGPLVAAIATAADGVWRHAVPPPVGTVLVPQPELFRCTSEAGARYAAETGFLAADCGRVERAGTWRVLRCIETTLSHGPLRLLEVASPDGERAWVPLPWHDWA